MSSRANRSLGRSMIPNYSISDVPLSADTTKKKKHKKKHSDFPSFGSDQYKESMEVIDKSKHYDKQVRYLVTAIIGMLIILALAPICIVILKKWRWRWLANIFGIQYTEDLPMSTQPTNMNGGAYTSMGNTTYAAPLMAACQTVSALAPQLAGQTIRPQVPVNPTGEGIDINKPYVIPSSALKTFTSSEL